MIARKFTALLLAVVSLNLFVAGAQADERVQADTPEAFIMALASRAYELTNVPNSDNIDRAAIRQLVLQNIDFRDDLRGIEGFSLGRHRRNFPADKRAQYVEAFTTFAARRYTGLLIRFGGQRVEVDNVIERRRDVIITTRVVGPSDLSGSVLNWRVVKREDGFKVFDVGADDIWIGIQQQQELVAIIDNNGGVDRGGVDALIAVMRAESAQANAATAPSSVSEL